MSKIKPEYISLLNIVPGKLYLAWTECGFKRPCTVVCDDTHGWQRGWVKKMDEIHRNGQHAIGITVNFVEPDFKSRDFYCRLVGDEYVARSWFDGYEPMLYEMPEDWFINEISRLQSQQLVLQKRINILQEIQHVHHLPIAAN